MEALLLKLQTDVAARKRPRREVMPAIRIGVLAIVSAFVAHEVGARSVDSSAGWIARAEARASVAGMRSELDAARGQIDIQGARLERLESAYQLSSRYGIGADLAMAIQDIALAEGIDPRIAFELVRVESGFNPRAVSPVGALGLTQLMPATAQIMSPGISRQQIFERETNLRLGFRFFNNLLTQYKGDVRLALLAYNRGPGTVDRLLAAGQDPGNGYATAVLGTRARQAN
ncbi:MAG TPA: lytic transglycosylase domain-containing protein [Longimicrobiaceae bacterium]|nr:lytic transglycosylase domain-containing protein [Longimicrobiaceae bacterium]